MKRYQKLLSVILAIMMVVSLLPANFVFAAEENYVVKAALDGTGWEELYTWCGNLSQNTNYTLSLKAKGTGAFWFGAKGGDWYSLGGTNVTATSEWTEYSVDVNTGTNGGLNLSILDQVSGGAGTVYIDDFKVTKKDDGTVVFEDTFESGLGWTNNTGLYSRVLEPEDGVEEPDPVVINHAMKTTATSASQYVYVNAWHQAVDGAEYTISFKVMGQGSVRVAYNQWGVGPEGSNKTVTVDSTEWKTVTSTFTVDRSQYDGQNGWSALILYGDAGNEGGTVYVDDIVVTNDTDGTTIVSSDLESGSWSTEYGGGQYEIVEVQSTTTPVDPEEPDPVVINHALKISMSNAGTWPYANQWKGALAPNTDYEAGFWIKGDGAIRLCVTDNNWSTIVMEDITATDTWTKVTLEFNTGSFNDWSMFALYDAVGGDAGSAVYIDDAFFWVKGSNENLLDNPGFEDGTNGWSPYDGMGDIWEVVETDAPGTSDSEDPEVPDPDNYVLEVQTTGKTAQDGAYITNGTGITVGEEYTVTFRAKGNGTVALTAARGGDWARLDGVELTTEKSDTWQEYEMKFTAELGTDSSAWNAVLLFDQSGEAGKLVFVDDIVLKDSQGTAVMTQDFQNGKNGWWTQGGFTYRIIPETDISFSLDEEEPATGLKVSTERETDATINDSVVYSGNYAMRMDMSNSGAHKGTYSVDIQPATNYVFTVWVKGTGSAGFVFRQANDQSDPTFYNDTVVLTGEETVWTKYTIEWTSPATFENGASVDICLYDNQGVADTYLVLDDMWFSEAGSDTNLLETEGSQNPGFESSQLGNWWGEANCSIVAKGDNLPENGKTDPDVKVTFGDNGEFADEFDSADNMAGVSSTAIDGNLNGPGHIVYGIGENDTLKGVTMNVGFSMWNMEYTHSADLKLFTATYDEESASFKKGSEIQLLRTLRPSDSASADWYMGTYVSAPVPEGTQYVWVELPTSAFFKSNNFSEFQVENITLYSTESDREFFNYTVDWCEDTSLMYSHTEAVVALDVNGNDNEGWYANPSPIMVKKNWDQADADGEIVYKVKDGETFNNIYVQAHYYDANTTDRKIEIWTSEDGEYYTKLDTQEQSPNGVWRWSKAPTVVATDIPDTAVYVKIVLPKLTYDLVGDIAGNAGPVLSCIAFGGALDEPPPPPDKPQALPDPESEYTVNFAEIDVTIDGVYDENEWADANVMNTASDVIGYDLFGAQLRWKYDYENLYLCALMYDPTPMRNDNTGDGIWNGDNIEIFYGLEDITNSTGATQMLATDYQIVISGGVSKGYQYYVNRNGSYFYPMFDDITIKAMEDGKGYIIEAAMPLKDIGINEPWNGIEMIMNVVEDEGDSPSRGQWGWAASGEGNKKNRSLWNTVTFAAADAPSDEITVSASIDPVNNLVTITGALLEDLTVRDVALLVYNSTGTAIFTDQVVSNADGSFSTTFTLDPTRYPAGEYTIIAGGVDISRKAEYLLIVGTPTTTAADLAAYYATVEDTAEENYTAESWEYSNFAARRAIAKELIDEGETDAVTLCSALAGLQNAYAKLEAGSNPPAAVDTSDLEAAIAQAGTFSEDDYTEDSWAALADALATGAYVLADENATQDDVDAAKEEILAAIDALEEKPASSEPEKPVKPTKPYVPPTHYVVVVKANEGGTVNPSGILYVAPGADQTITVTPDAGYYVKQVLLDRKEEVQLVNGTFTLKNVTEPYTIDVIFEKIPVGIEVTDPETPPATSNPQTGDSGMNFALLAILLSGIALAVVARKRHEA